ncbi:hypothetical protein ACFWXB_13930 [Tsukamurella tyrosinosolvens]|uniref:hypothetical protein n=1 Tax=Tsukamurella tyrosinosolvens TaxID=57704 RepID=UPI002DD433C1|nr:hypothetical protein [Tsukamurella tyrosinosolvens]MEC4612870.1 hypothetical protein [Tsukamurella tyrosinosolvens]
MSWEVFVIGFRDGDEVNIDLDLAEWVLARHGVEAPGARQRIHRDPSDPELWTEFTVQPEYIGFERPAEGAVWNLIFDLMLTCGAGLTDPMENVVVPSEQVRGHLPAQESFNSVFVATSVDELLAAPWPEENDEA